MKIRTKRTIRKKVALLVLAVSLSTVLLMGLAAALGLVSIRGDTMASLDEINGRTAEDATAALRSQAQSELVTLVENKSSLADTSLGLILNQTRLVAMAAEEIYSNPEAYLAGVDPDNPPLDAYDFSCNYDEGVLGSFSYHLRAPRGVLTNVVEDGSGAVLSADLDAGALTPEQRRELYLASFLKTALGGIRNFDNGDGTYTGIGATYFCLASSGIDILADTLTMDMVEYDARGSEWYIEAANLGPGEVYWTDPLQDASGRGASLICAMPVYVDGELIGVAGSGGDIDNIREIVQSTTIGESGYAMLVSRRRPGEVNVIASANPDAGSELGGSGNLMLTPNAALARALTAINRGESGVTELPIDGESVYLAYHPLETTDWSMVTVISLDDATITEPIEQLRGNIDAVTADTGEDMGARLTLLMLLFAAIALAAAIVVVAASWKFSARLTRPLTELTEGVRRISGGDLDFKLEVSSGDETAVLGDAFNHMTSSLRAYIDNLARVTAEKERIGAELHVATQIQSSMLPCIFPAFPERGEFDVYASMTPAKEVGGDFYDFFLVDEDHLALVIADVSGKGVPAALFMVIAKTLLKNRAQMGASPKEILETVNNQLCENNDAEMFVTVWLGVYEISTGRVTAANAGHEYPAIRRKGGKFELFRDKHGFVLAGMENMRYREYEFTLEPGDELFVYTDGVTEATDASSALCGTERMLAALDGCASDSPEALLHGVKADIDAFVGGAPQFDDITMLCLKRSEGGDGVKEITLEATVENIAAVTEFADGVLEGLGCPAKARAQLDVAIDELFSNIARYAYAPGTGSVTVRVEALEGPRAVEFTFIDSGVPYDPLAREDPNTGLPLEEREAGGLGIFIVKKTMDAMSYEYANGQNILRIKKLI